MPSAMAVLLFVSTLLVVGSAVNCRPDRFGPFFLPFPSFPRFNFNRNSRFPPFTTTTLPPLDDRAAQPVAPVDLPTPPLAPQPPLPETPVPIIPPPPQNPQMGRGPPQNPQMGRGPPQNPQMGQVPPQNPPMDQIPPQNPQMGQVPPQNPQIEQIPPNATMEPNANDMESATFPDIRNSTMILTRTFPTCAEYGCAGGQGCDHATKTCRTQVIDI